ncbi:MAG: PqqD family protein [Flavobacteriales bacterium]|nr:PqqD family protein [Flavobacteriales bacterium]
MNIKEIANKKSDFAAKTIGEELVLVPVKSSVAVMDEMFTLNDVASFIWEELNVDLTENSLTEKLVLEFDIDKETASADLKSFLLELEKMMNG